MKKKELLKELKLIEKELNNIYCNEDVVVNIELNKNEYDENIIMLELKDSFDNEMVIDCNCLYDEGKNMDTLLYELIRDVYENSVNPLSRFIKSTKSFNSRKIKSLALWKSRNRQDKVNEIVSELIERHLSVEKSKNQLLQPKELIRNLYQIKSRYAESEVI